MAAADSGVCTYNARLGSARPVGDLESPWGGLVRPTDYMVCVDACSGHIIELVGVVTYIAMKVALR